jgi:hypothetical protein
MNERTDGTIDQDEFVESFLNIEDILKKHHLEILHQTRTHREQREEYNERLKEAKGTEKINGNLMEGSYLSVKVIEARNLKAVDDDQGADPYV